MNERLMPQRTRVAEPVLPSLDDTASRADDGQMAGADRDSGEDHAEAIGELPAGHSISRITVQPRARYALSQPGDPSEREADRAAEQVMSGGTAPRLSAAAPTQNSAPDLMRDAGDAASAHDDDVPEAVDEALQTDGQPLNESVRTLLEPRFGHAFGNVRVHTDSRAAESAQALNALAYTVGNDVVFGNGRYAPETDAGQHLIAHELTHVVQQSAAPEGNQAARMVQRASEVIPQVGWGSVPKFADDSKITFNPFARLTLGGASFDNWFPSADKGVSQESFTLPKGTIEGSLMIQVTATWFKDDITENLTGEGLVTATNAFTVTPEGGIQWQSPTPLAPASNNGNGAQLVIPVPATASGNIMTVTPTVNGVGSTGDTSTSTVSVAPGGIGGSKAEGKTVTSPSGASATRPYSIKLITTPDPGETIRETTSAYFAIDSDVVVDNTGQQIARWYQTQLPEDMRKSIEDGVTEMQITGHASTTNTFSYNLDLSKRRAQKVEAILREFASSKAKLVHAAPSFTQAAQYDQAAGKVDKVEEDPNERRVDIWVEYVKKPGAPPASGSGTPKP